MVANLSEAAAETIGANPTICRVCSYFHDIGKLVKPEYFTENMRAGRNPHDDLAPTMSALIIIAHVKEGVDLALKHKLNQRIIDVIQEHHGTSMVGFFYKRALQQQEDARQGGKIMNIRAEDIPEVREESFRYSGPRPQSREAGIISLADAVESASRSLEKVTAGRLEQLIHDIIQKRIIDGQLDECDITMREIQTISDSFAFTLQNMLHSRIAYPTETVERPEPHALPAERASRFRRLDLWPMPARRGIQVFNRQRRCGSICVAAAVRRRGAARMRRCRPRSRPAAGRRWRRWRSASCRIAPSRPCTGGSWIFPGRRM